MRACFPAVKAAVVVEPHDQPRRFSLLMAFCSQMIATAASMSLTAVIPLMAGGWPSGLFSISGGRVEGPYPRMQRGVDVKATVGGEIHPRVAGQRQVEGDGRRGALPVHHEQRVAASDFFIPRGFSLLNAA